MAPSSDHVLVAIPSLPALASFAEPAFIKGGVLNGDYFAKVMLDAYEEVAHRRKHYFSVPCGECEKALVFELTHLFRRYTESSSIESVSMKAVIVLCILLLQCPHSRVKNHDYA